MQDLAYSEGSTTGLAIGRRAHFIARDLALFPNQCPNARDATRCKLGVRAISPRADLPGPRISAFTLITCVGVQLTLSFHGFRPRHPGQAGHDPSITLRCWPAEALGSCGRGKRSYLPQPYRHYRRPWSAARAARPGRA